MPGVNDVVSGQQQNEINKDAPVDVVEKNNKEILAKDLKADPLKEDTRMADGDKASVANGNHAAAEDKTQENGDGSKQDEIVMIQDTGFNVKIHAPGVEPFDLPVSAMELVQEIYQVLTDKEDTCHRTCFSLQLDGQVLDNFAELKTIEGLKEGSVIKVIEEPYTAREARLHLRHVNDLLRSVGNQDAYNGVNCCSLSMLNTVTMGNLLDKKVTKPDSLDCTPPEYIMPGGVAEVPLLPLHPALQDTPDCVKVLTYSGWNPPPPTRKMHGDLLYIYAVTMENKQFHITASTKGFYVNQTTQDEFNPKPANQKYLSHSLVDLLSQVSSLFKKNFQALLKKRAAKHPFERVATPYQVYSWVAPPQPHTVDYIRAEDAFAAPRLGHEEHIPGQTRDWNEELQTTRELVRATLPDRLVRERAIFKVHSDFVVAATRGAVAVIDGNIMPINPGEDSKMQMFLWSNIFFSLGFDVKDHYKDFGGDYAAYVAPGNDLQGVRAYAGVDSEGLFTLGTVVVDYRGYRVTAQSIIPGILEREQEQSVVYGSIDFGKTVVSNEKYKELLEKTSQSLKIRPHKVINEKDEEIELWSSVECKGIVGNDQRYYVLDLLRTFPPDTNYLPVEGEEVSALMKQHGYPKQHRHRLVTLRHELIDAFVENRYMSFVKNAAKQFQTLRLQKLKEKEEKKEEEKKEEEGVEEGKETEVEEAKKLMDTLTSDDNTKEIVKSAAAAVGSLSETEFEVKFNPDVFQPHVRLADEESETYKKEKQLVKDAAEFLVVHQIPTFIRDCLEHTSSPIDGYTLTEALHHCGINMRYLGKVTELVSKSSQLSYLYSICISELVSRAAKHLYKSYMQGVDTMCLSAGISHFLNCYLSSYPKPESQLPQDELQSSRAKKRNKKKNKGSLAQSTDNTEWMQETPKTMWRKITDEVRDYYGFNLKGDSVEAVCERYGVRRVALLRAFCKKCGVQLLLRDYALDNKNRPAFSDDDILNTYPIVKNIQPKASDAYHVFTSGQNKIQQGLLREGYELISEALNLLNNVYGAMHPEIAACCRLLARLNYIMGDYNEALVYQQRAVLMSERVLGIDHPNTITEYAHLALYCFANHQISTALRLMYRARYLALLCHGDSHPEVALFDSNIGLILHAVEEFDLSLIFMENALRLNIKFFGEKSLKVAMNYHLVARTHSCKGEFRVAINKEKEAFAIYKQLLGEDHERTKESSECLRHLTDQAVKFQKTMNQLQAGGGGGSIASIAPMRIQTPTLASVLEMLNLINGIVFLHISQEDIEKFRQEMTQRQTREAATATEATEAVGAAGDAPQPAVPELD